MNWTQALKKLQEGERVRSANWSPSIFIYSNRGVLAWNSGANVFFDIQTSLDFAEYTDWEVVSPSISGHLSKGQREEVISLVTEALIRHNTNSH